MAQKRFYGAVVNNVLVRGRKETRYRVMDRVTGKVAIESKGFGGALSEYYPKMSDANKVASDLNRKYPQLKERWR